MLTYDVDTIKSYAILSDLRTISELEFSPHISTLEKAKVIIGYAHGMFNHDGDNLPSSTNPLTILKEAQSGKEFRCVEYSLLAVALLWSYGIPARTIGLKTQDVETRSYGAGHVVIEFWDDELRKWIFADVQAGILITHDHVYLSSYELSLLKDEPDKVALEQVTNSRFGKDGMFKDKHDYLEWIKE